MAKKVRLGKAKVDNVTQQEAISHIQKMIENGEKGYVVTPNLDHIVKLEEDAEFVECYENASLVLPDGNPLIWASKALGTPLKELVTGSDLFPALCRHASLKGYSLFFLGGLEGVAESAAINLKTKFPEINVVGTYSPPFGFEKDQEENDGIISMINDLKPNILFVGVGAPKQEKWMFRNIDKLDVNVALGIGASFDFEAGSIKRAPGIVRKMGMEWFWRFSNEPGRLFRRYFIDSQKFAPIILKQYRQEEKNNQNNKSGND